MQSWLGPAAVARQNGFHVESGNPHDDDDDDDH